MFRTSVWAMALSAATTACAIHTTDGMAKALVSGEQETQLGAEVKHELDKRGTKYIQDPEIVNYVQGLAKKVFASADKDRLGVNWQVAVIDNPNQVKAFTTPGGYLYVYTGLLMAADNEAQLAGVWGHESGHVVARHADPQIVDELGVETVIGIEYGQNRNQLAQLAATLAAKGAVFSYSRQDETEADEYGARYSARAGYDPQGLIQLFKKQNVTADRITHLQQYISEKQLSGTELGAEPLQPVKQKLQNQATSTSGAAPAAR